MLWVATTSANPNSRLERIDQVEYALAGVGVEMPGRLVAQEQLRLLGERARDRDALRLAARQLRWQMVELRAESHQLEQRAGGECRVGLAAVQLLPRRRRSRTR